MFFFSFFTVMNNATVNNRVLVLCGHVFSSLGQVPRSGIAQLYKVKLCLSFCPFILRMSVRAIALPSFPFLTLFSCTFTFFAHALQD